jgi:hypothetical protein
MRGTPATTTADAPRVPDGALVRIVSPLGGSGTVVAPPDRRSLVPGRPRAEIGEYHDTWSVSPDRGRIALGISAPGTGARIGIRILDRATLETVQDVETGIVAEAVGWLSRERVGGILQSGEAVVADAVTGGRACHSCAATALGRPSGTSRSRATARTPAAPGGCT